MSDFAWHVVFLLPDPGVGNATILPLRSRPGQPMKILRLVASTVLACAAFTAAAQDKPLRIVLGYPPGASSDTLTRLLADRMRPLIGQPVMVENKPGADGRIGNETVKAAPPDGSTIMLTPVATMAAFPHSHGAVVRYDPFKDFEPIAHLANFQLSLVVNAEVQAKNVAEYVALVKKDPRMGDYASAAAGSLLGLRFVQRLARRRAHRL